MRLTRVIGKLEPGGAQLGALHLSVSMRELGIETRVLAGHATPEGLALFREAGLEVEAWAVDPDIQYACRDAFAAWLTPRLRACDIVHAHMFGGWWAAAMAVPEHTPLVASEHNALHWPGTPRLAAMRRALRRVDVFFAHGPASRSLLVALGFPADRLRDGRTAIAGLDSRPLRGLPRRRLVYAGRLEHEKGPDVLLEAFARLRRPPATIFLGRGSMESELRERASRLGLGRLVSFPGWKREPGRFIAGASACVVPSRREAVSQTALLGMGLGVPVVAAAAEGLPAVVRGRGVLVPPDDPVRLAAALDDLLAGRTSLDLDGARAYARGFERERVAAYYAAAYRELGARRHRERRTISAPPSHVFHTPATGR